MDDEYDVDELDYDDEYHEPADVESFCELLKEAWSLNEEAQFGDFLEFVFNGYDLRRLTHEDMEEMLKEFILQNK